MSEPQYMQGDSIALSMTELSTAEYTCECGHEATVEVEEKVHLGAREVTYWGEYTCPNCNQENLVEGWYSI